ncbi:MAG TPA: sigma-70 family RNA polymerase sigma factor [Acidimicrobiales bacterium]|nr:sigma-70 family RNA polymerase sigma factor [Acidimicrobiales bacterium]
MHDEALRPLLDAAVEGDDRAVAELVRATQPAVWRLCAALGSPGEEEDLVQEVYVRALRAAAGYRADAPVLPWLLAIARNVCADDVRRRQRQRRVLERLRVLAIEPAAAPSEFVDDLLAALEPQRRDAFVMTQLVGLSYEEAAVALDCPVGTVRSRVARARADLSAAVRRADAV